MRFVSATSRRALLRYLATLALAGDGRRNPFKSTLTAGIDLSARDRGDLGAFLKTVTHRRLLTDKRF